MTALSVRDLRVSLGGRPVLTGVDLTVRPGLVHALLGPNGAGKTTLLRAIQGLVRISSGSIEHGGQIGYVPQRHDVAWDFPITAQQVVMTGLVGQIGFFRRPRVEHHRAVARALRRVRMAELRDRPIGEMSGGQRQRVMIARALALDPAVLLLDEPFTGLDMPTQELLTALFTDLAAEGTALLMTSHDLTHAMVTSDHVTLLNRTVIASDAPGRLRDEQTWMRAFEVSATSPLLAQLGLATRSKEPTC